eukprot:Nk52_evm14s2209 gene=Nk52_evmTU14s2209
MAPVTSINTSVQDSSMFQNIYQGYEIPAGNENQQRFLYHSAPAPEHLEQREGDISAIAEDQSLVGEQQFFHPHTFAHRIASGIPSAFNPTYEGYYYENQMQVQPRRQSGSSRGTEFQKDYRGQQPAKKIEQGQAVYQQQLKHGSMTSNSSSYFGEVVPGATTELDSNGYYGSLLGNQYRVPQLNYFSDLTIGKLPYNNADLLVQSEMPPGGHANKFKRKKGVKESEKEPVKESSSSTVGNSISKGNSSQCVDCFKDLGVYLEEFNQFGLKKGKGGDMSRDVKSQNEFLIERLLDDKGEYKYHSRCMLKVFKISKGRLNRIKEKKKRIIKGIVNSKHGLCGRPSNNRKNAETLNQFADFILNNRSKCSATESGEHRTRQYRMLPSLKRVQGDGPESIRGQFNLFQKSQDPTGVVRQTLSNGTAQAWFNKYFSDSTCLSASSFTSNFSLGSDFNVSVVEKPTKTENFVIDTPEEIEATKKALLGNNFRNGSKASKQLSAVSLDHSLYSEMSGVSGVSGDSSFASSRRNSVKSEDLNVPEEEEPL